MPYTTSAPALGSQYLKKRQQNPRAVYTSFKVERKNPTPVLTPFPPPHKVLPYTIDQMVNVYRTDFDVYGFSCCDLDPSTCLVWETASAETVNLADSTSDISTASTEAFIGFDCWEEENSDDFQDDESDGFSESEGDSEDGVENRHWIQLVSSILSDMHRSLVEIGA